MSGRLWLLSCLVYGLLFLGLVRLRGEIIALALPLVIYLGAVFFYEPGRLKLRVVRNLSEECVPSEKPVTVGLSVVNEGSQLVELLIEEEIPPLLEWVEGPAQAIAALPPGGRIDLKYNVRGKRGRYLFKNIRVTTSDPFGLFRRQIRLSAPGHLLVVPEVLKLQPVAIRPRQTRDYHGPVPARLGGSGVEFFGVREYQSGDPMRWINWRLSARHAQDLFTNEFEQERIADVGLILDSRQQTDVPALGDSLFEYSVRATAALAEMFLDAGNRVGLLIYGRGREMIFPGYGKIQRERILRSLAQARTGDNLALESLGYLPARFFPARSQIVLVSPLSQDDLPVLSQLRAFGYQVLVVSPDPVTYEAEVLGPRLDLDMAVRIARLERVLLLQKLRRVGIQVVSWQVDKSFNQVIHAVLGRLPRGLAPWR